MPPVPDWSAPTQFDLTNPFNGTLSFNVATTVEGNPCRYLLDMKRCKARMGVRATVNNVPQSDGYIFHRRFLTGSQIDLTIQLWETEEQPACDEVLVAMLDELTGALRSLLNAGDNEGRLAWTIAGGGNTRMLDDCRLLVYPDYTETDAANEVTVTIDSEFPYAQDLNQQMTSVAAGGTAVIDNTGTAPYYPVVKVYGPAAGATVRINDIDLTFTEAIGGGDFVEIDYFKNTMFLNGNLDDELSGLDILGSVLEPLIPGNNTVEMFDADADFLWAPAWG